MERIVRTILIITTCLIFIVAIWVPIGVENNRKLNQKQHDEDFREIRPPDSNREVYGWDYTNNTYLYKDQIKPRQKYNDALQAKPLPDFYTQPISPSRSQPKANKPSHMFIDGKRYAIIYRSNGVIEIELED